MRSFGNLVAALVALSVATMSTVARAQATNAVPLTSTNAPPASKIIAPAHPDLPLAPAEVLRMSEAGVSDELIISYIEKSENPYFLSANQIVYLHDVGVSSAVLKALVDRSGTAVGGQGTETSEQTSVAPSSSSTIMSQGTVQSNPTVSGVAANYYNSLAPYGTWLYVTPYGWCWQPSVVVVNPGWQPYCNNGCWLWTSQGWYWNSYYSWGWAPFHYGRWCQYPGYGWLWCPGNVWGPAWVCWRNYPGYCGWAPLPPGAYFTAGVGWTYYGTAVGFYFGFGLGPSCFTFCSYNNFCKRRPYHYFKHGRDASHYYHHSRVNNDYAMGRHHEIFNRGVPPSRIEAASHSRIRQVAIREIPHETGRSGNFTMPDRLTQSGNGRVIYRPGRNVSAVRNPFLPGRNTQMAAQRTHAGAAQGFTARRSVGNTFRFQTTRQRSPQRSAPGVVLNQSRSRTFSPYRGTTGNSHVMRSGPQTVRRPGYTYSGRSEPVFRSAPAIRSTPTIRSAPARHFTPSSSFRSAPSRPAPRSFSRPAPSFGGGRSAGGARFSGGAHFGGGGGGHGGRR